MNKKSFLVIVLMAVVASCIVKAHGISGETISGTIVIDNK